MQSLQGLLFERFDGHRMQLGATRGFEQGAGIGGVGLVALDVGAHVSRREQLDGDAERMEPACPMVSRAAGFHHHQLDTAIAEPALELGTGETMSFDHFPGVVGDGELEDTFREIDADNGGTVGDGSSSIHVGLLRVER
jgi:hypothetical protein